MSTYGAVDPVVSEPFDKPAQNVSNFANTYKNVAVVIAVLISILILSILYLARQISKNECEIYTTRSIAGKCERVDVNYSIQQFQEMVLNPKVSNQQKMSAAGFLVARYPDIIENLLQGKTDGLNAKTLALLDEAKKMAPPMALPSGDAISGIPQNSTERFCNC